MTAVRQPFGCVARAGLGRRGRCPCTSAPTGGRGRSAAAVSAVREEWLVEDGWWTREPLRRRYFELVLEDGSDVVVFCEPGSGRWFRQRA